MAWPLGQIASWGAFAVIALASYGATRPHTASYAEWVAVSGSTHESMLLVGPVIAFCAGIMGYLLAGRSSIFFGQAVGRRTPQLLRHVVRFSIGSVAAMALGWIPSWIWAFKTATWGGPSVWDLLITFTGVVLVSSGSFVIGSMLPRQAWVVVLPVAWLVVFLLPRWLDRAFSVVVPVQSWTSSVRFSPNPAVAIYFLVFAVFVAFCALALFNNQRGHELLAPETGAATVAFVALVAVPFVWRPDLYTLRHQATPFCERVAATSVCVHPGHKTSLAGIVNALSSLQRSAGTTFVARVTDEAAANDLVAKPGEVLVSITPATTGSSVAYQVVFAGTGQEMCSQKYVEQQGSGAPAANLAAAIGSRVLRDAGDSDGAANMAQLILDKQAIRSVNQLSSSNFTQLIRSKRTQLEQCSLTYAEVR